MSGNDPIIIRLLTSIQDFTSQGAATAEAVAQLTSRFDRLETRLFGEKGEITRGREDVEEVKDKLTWARGYLAGMLACFSLGGSGATLLIQWLFRKFGGH